MRAEVVLMILDALENAGLKAWLDGGWGVNALLGYESRRHDDLDLVVELCEVSRITEVLGSLAFMLSTDELPVRFVMVHPELGEIDFHPVTFDEGGGGIQAQPSGKTFRYPPEGFAGSGTILSRAVPCLTPDAQVLCHRGYEPKDKDVHDLVLLHEAFGVPLPRVCALLDWLQISARALMSFEY